MKIKKEIISVGNIPDEIVQDNGLFFEFLKNRYDERQKPLNKLLYFDLSITYSDCPREVACDETGQKFSHKSGWVYVISKWEYILNTPYK